MVNKFLQLKREGKERRLIVQRLMKMIKVVPKKLHTKKVREMKKKLYLSKESVENKKKEAVKQKGKVAIEDQEEDLEETNENKATAMSRRMERIKAN
ncbi:hypothetical protein QYF36_002189 [Acer negundo]|nr:hypothetical protein QYF36_002189 [Acer negundo]